MGFGGHTAYKFRHWKIDPETGLRVLDWASAGKDDSLDLRNELIVKGSPAELEVIEAQDWTLNALADEGEEDILNVYFDTQAVRANLYFRLYNDTPAEGDTLASLTGEVTGTGYTGIAVARGTDWSAPDAATGTSTGTKTFTAGGSWSAATQLILATAQTGTSGLLIAYAALSQTRTLGNGDTLDVTMTVTLE